MDSLTFELDNKQFIYKKSKSFLRSVEKEITLVFIKEDYTLVQNYEILSNNTNIKKEELSKYFDDYFMYPKSLHDNSEFIYYESNNRKELN